jgi:hypothetical protein
LQAECGRANHRRPACGSGRRAGSRATS